MTLSYAGIDLTPKTPRLAALMARWWPEHAPDLWQTPSYYMERTHHLPIPTPPEVEPARLNTLYWPGGASRWATFHALVGGEQAADIQALVGVNAPTPQTLLIRDDVQDVDVTPSMYMLGLQPIYVQDDDAELWWLTLVDARYFWYTRQLTYTFTSGSSWSTLLTNLVTAASGLTPTVPTVPAAYGTPNHLRWYAQSRPLPHLIDAAAATVGFRFVYKLDGTCAFVDAASADAADAARYAANSSALAMGGRTTVQEVVGDIPANVAVTFWGDVQTITTVSLASLALAEYGTVTGVANTYAWVSGDMRADTASGTLTTYAQQAATDYYRWALCLVNATFRGVRDIDLTGQEDRLEWEYMPGITDKSIPDADGSPRSLDPSDRKLPWERVLTRIVRQNWGDSNVYGDRAPPGYTYHVKLTAQSGVTWKSLIQIVSGGAITDGPQLGFGADSFVLYSRTSPSVGDYGVAVPDPLTAGIWQFIPSGASTGSGSGSGSGAGSCSVRGIYDVRCINGVTKVTTANLSTSNNCLSWSGYVVSNQGCCTCGSGSGSGSGGDQGPGWYCLSCGVASPSVVFSLTTPANACAGPYATEAQALAACTAVTIACSTPPNTINGVITVTAGSGTCASAAPTGLNGQTFTMTQSSPTPPQDRLFYDNGDMGVISDVGNGLGVSCEDGVWTAFGTVILACTWGVSPGFVVTLVAANHIRLINTFGGALCIDCGNQTVTLQIDLTW